MTKYPVRQMAKHIQTVNDILQGRTERTIDDLLGEVKQKGGEAEAGRIGRIEQEIKGFQSQCTLLSKPYTSPAATGEQIYLGSIEDGTKPIITQEIYDKAARLGFPPDFFRRSHFDRVTFYCIPDHTDFNFSYFSNCTFAVCRIREATFDGASIYSSEFHSCAMQYATFFKATIAHTHFHDSTLQNVSFQDARLKSCNTIDCKLDGVGFLNATLDNCFFGRVAAHGIRNLHTATITMGGATDGEVKHNREAIYSALRLENKARQPMPHRARETR